MSRIRLNQEYRNKIANRIKVHLQQEDTHEKQTTIMKLRLKKMYQLKNILILN